MIQDRNDLAHHYAEMRQSLLSVLSGLSADAQSSRLVDGWTAKDHLAHITAWDELRAAEIERISAGYDSACQMSEEQSDAYSTLAYELRKGHSLKQVRWEFDRAHQRLLDAIAQASDRGLDGALYAEAGLRSDHEAAHATWLGNYGRE